MAIRILKIEDITAYKVASEISDYAWKTVSKWDWFSKRAIGIQFIKATDSIAGNIFRKKKTIIF